MRVREVRRNWFPKTKSRTTEMISLTLPTMATFAAQNYKLSGEVGKIGSIQIKCNVQDTTLTTMGVIQWLIGWTQGMWPQCWRGGRRGTIGGWSWQRKQSSIFFSLNNSTISSRPANLLTSSRTWQLQRRERYCRAGSSTSLWTWRAHNTTTTITTTTIPSTESINPCSTMPFHSYNPKFLQTTARSSNQVASKLQQQVNWEVS